MNLNQSLQSFGRNVKRGSQTKEYSKGLAQLLSARVSANTFLHEAKALFSEKVLNLVDLKGLDCLLFEDNRTGEPFTVIKFWMDETSGIALALETGIPSYQVEDEEGRIHLPLHFPIEEKNEDRWCPCKWIKEKLLPTLEACSSRFDCVTVNLRFANFVCNRKRSHEQPDYKL